MKALILCGGFAKRLGFLGNNTPKPLLEVGGKPVLSHTVEKLQKTEGIDEIIISTNSKFEKNFRKWAESQNGKRVSIVAEPADSEEKKLGAVAAVDYALKQCSISDDVLLIMGDNLFDFDMNRFVNQFKRVKTPCHVVFDIGSREKTRMYGVPQISEGLIIKVAEKPQYASGTIVCTGIYFFTQDSLKLIGEYLKTSSKKDRMGDFMSWFVEKTPVHAFRAGGRWFDIGDAQSLKEARRWAENE